MHKAFWVPVKYISDADNILERPYVNNKIVRPSTQLVYNIRLEPTTLGLLTVAVFA